MAQKLPQFESTVTVQPGPLVSEAPSFEAAAKVAGNLSDMVDKNLQRKADQQAVAQGGIAGENLGFQPAKGGGRAAEIYNVAALRSNKYALAADIGTKMQNLTGELSKNVNGNETLDEFRMRAQGYSEGLLSNIPKANEPYAKNLLQAHANAGLTKLQGLVNKQNNAIAFDEYHEKKESITADMSNAAFQGNGPIAMHDHALLKKMAHDGSKGGFLTPVQFTKGILDADQSFNTGRLLHKYQLAQQADKFALGKGKIATARKDFRKFFMKDKSYDKIFNVKERMGMMSKFDQLDKIEFDKTNMTAAHLKNLTDNLLFKIKNGGQADSGNVAMVMSASKDPEDLKQKIDLAHYTWSKAAPHQYDSIDQQTAASSDLKTITPELVAQNAPLAVYNANLDAAKQIDNWKTLRLADPVAQTQNSPALQHTFQQIDNGELKMTKDQAIVNYLKSLKQPDNKIRVERNDQSSAQVRTINQMASDPNQGNDAVLGALLDQRASEPKTFHYYFNGLMDNGLSPRYQTMMNMWMNPANRSNIDTYNAAWDAAHTSATGKTLPPGKTGSILDEQVSKHALIADKNISNIDTQINQDLAPKIAPFIATLTTGAANNAKQIQQVTDDVTNVTKYLYAEKGMSRDNAEKAAVDMIITKIFPVINGTYRVPFDVDPDHVKAKMREKDLAIKRNEADLKIVGGAGKAFTQEQRRTGFIQWFEKRDLFMGGAWTNNPNGKGYIKLTIDGNKIIDNKTGKPYGFDTDDMKIDSKVKTLNPGQTPPLGRRFEGGLPLIPLRQK